MTDGSGTIASGGRYNYDAYGVSLGSQPSTVSPSLTSLLYTGEQFDTGLQQYYLRARYYNQNNGRFNQIDPFDGIDFDPQSLHKYAYAHGDPVFGSDPSGQLTLVEMQYAITVVFILAAFLIVGLYAAKNLARIQVSEFELGSLEGVQRNTQPKTKPAPYAPDFPPYRPPKEPDEHEVKVYRDVKGSPASPAPATEPILDPSQFKATENVPTPPGNGMSVSNVPFRPYKEYLFQFTIRFKGNHAPGVVGSVVEVPGLKAIYDPITTGIPNPTHWDIQRVPGDPLSGPAPLTAAALSTYALGVKELNSLGVVVYKNPAYVGREVHWPHSRPPLPYWIK